MTNRSYITGALAILALLLCSGLALAGGIGGKNETAATNWLVIINDPGACAHSPCEEGDIFGPAFADPPPDDTNPTKATVCYLTGQSVQANGRATFAGRFAEGTNYGCFFPDGSAYGLMDADAAEVHMVLQEHGYSLKSGYGLEMQVAYFEGMCNPECNDTQFTIHSPGDVDGNGVSVSNIYRFDDGSLIDDTTSTLVRESDDGQGGIRMINHTRLEEDE